MALALTQVYARTPYRLRAIFSGGNPSSQVPSSFTITRQDGGPCAIAVSTVVSIDPNSLDLCLSSTLLIGVYYKLTWSAQAFSIRYVRPASEDPAVAPAVDDDPETEAFGYDVAWLFSDLGPDGDCPARTGRACLENDFPVRAFLMKGELVHLSDAGGNLPQRVNGPNDTSTLEAAGEIENDWRTDDRASDVKATPVTNSDLSVSINGTIVPRATGLPLSVRST